MTFAESQASALTGALDIIARPRKPEPAPGILGDPVWWLEHAMTEIENSYLDGRNLDSYMDVLRRIRDDAWDCQTGRIDAVYQDELNRARHA